MQIDKTSISSESLSFPVEPQLSLGSRANHILLEKDTERQVVIKKLNKIKTEKIEPREFLLKIKEAFNFADKKTSAYVSNRIKNSRFTLRLADHSVNADYVSDKYIETSIVIRLSYNEFKKRQDKYVIEFEYKPEMLTPEKKQQIIDNLKTWTLTGQYPETDIEPKYSPSESEWKKANEKMLNYVKTHSSKIQKYAETKPEIPVVKGEIKSILGNKFSGGNIKLTEDFQNELIEKGLVKPEDEFILINDEEAAAQGTKIKSDQPFVTLNIPVENNGKTDFVQTKYYHVSALNKSVIPEFVMITQHGLKTYKNMVVDNYEEHTNSYLLKSQDGQEIVRVTENVLQELQSKEYSEKLKTFNEKKEAEKITDTAKLTEAEKLTEAQYQDFFKTRSNTANNFRHNLSALCRKEANTPLDALKIASSIISQMSKVEKLKTKELLNKLKKKDQTINELLIETYHEAVKAVPLNEEYLKNQRYEKIVARKMYDTVSENGQKIDNDYNLKIGDSVPVAFKGKTQFGKSNIYQNCTIVSASKETNKVILMDENKSFYEVARDKFLDDYAKKEKIQQKQERKTQRSRSIEINIGR